jgi:two-component system sensor histidine kinase ChiS
MDGYAVCRELRTTQSAAALPVIMLTCRNRVEDIVEGFAAGANDYLTKPFSRDELVARVSTQLQLQKAHEVLEENANLKREIILRRKTEQDLRLGQLQFSRMLDSIREPVFAVNQSQEVGFCNRAFELLTGYRAQDLLGQPLTVLLSDAEGAPARALLQALPQLPASEEQSVSFADLGLTAADGRRLSFTVTVSALEMEDEALYLMGLLPGDGQTGAEGAVLSAAVLRGLEANRQRLRKIEDALLSLQAGDEDTRQGVLDDLRAIDSLLDNVAGPLQAADKLPGSRRLAVQVMLSALECWAQATQLGKGDLAMQSGIWNVYMERDGYIRTQTLDKYLSEATLPLRPRWQKIFATAEFVLANCAPDLPQCQELKSSLASLKRQS